ncbi:MAG: hypothetical protein ABIC19_02665 [Patescibacteria group bacterium]
MENKKTGKLAILIALTAILTAVFTGVIVYFATLKTFNSQNPLSAPPAPSSQILNNQRQSAGQSDTIANWPVYTDPESKFSFQYPPGTQIKSPELNAYTITDDKDFMLSLSVYKNNCSGQCFDQELVQWWPKTKLSSNQLTINGYDALEIFFDDAAGSSSENNTIRKQVYLKSDENLVIYFEFSGLRSTSSPLPGNFQKIIDSFKFTQ